MFLTVMGGSTFFLLAPGCQDEASPPPQPFFSTEERQTLSALADAILPADGSGPGAGALGAATYIETLLTALEFDPPRLFAGGPFSGRRPFPNPDGTPSTRFPDADFRHFLPLTRVQAHAWRLRLYGGPAPDSVRPAVIGWRDQMRDGLRAAMAAGGAVWELKQADLESLLDDLPEAFRSLLSTLVLESVFAAPEYGGNRDAAGWRALRYAGDSPPLGYSHFDEAAGLSRERAVEPVSKPDPGADPDPMDQDVVSLLEKAAVLLGGRVFP